MSRGWATAWGCGRARLGDERCQVEQPFERDRDIDQATRGSNMQTPANCQIGVRAQPTTTVPPKSDGRGPLPEVDDSIVG